jgi:glycosyltransferase involved in cell wall biosynthesis
MKLSVVINTKNSASTLKKTLESVKFADEIVVVDMNSVDDTVKLAKKFTSKVFHHKDAGYVEPARNFAINKASHDWILIVDSDEVVSTGLKNYIERILKSKQPADIYLIPRQNIIFGETIKYTGWWPDYQPRLFKKGQINWPEKIHQHPTLKGKVQKLPAEKSLAIVHHNYDDVSSYLERLNRYTLIQAQNETEGFTENVNASKIMTSFFEEFFRRFFVLSGYKDQVVGTSLAFLQAMYELVVKLRMWELQENSPIKQPTSEIITTLETNRNHLNYWLADWHTKNSIGLKKIYWQVRRKLQI